MKSKIFILLLLPILLNSQDCITINKVYSFTAGEGQNLGQSEEYFPANIFGIPSRIASDVVAEASQEEVLSIGLGGEIIVGNSDFIIVDKDGADFTIFENVFKNPINGRYFKEPAVVSVSKDGVNYIDFPYDFASLEGCAGTNPTFGNQDYCDYTVSGGDSFDLSMIGIDSIRFIKIKDITKELKENTSHKFYDFSLSGFDLDAVVIHSYEKSGITNIANQVSKPYYIQNYLFESKSNANQTVITDIMGKVHININGFCKLDLNTLNSGVYFISIENKGVIFVEKFII